MAQASNHIKFNGLSICIETPKGQRRRPDWPEMPADYGYIKRTEGADGEGIDVFVGPHRQSEMVYVIDHCRKDGSFDEHKVMLGYTNNRKALEAFKASYDKGCKVGKVTAMTISQFKEWMKNGDLRSPVCDQVSRYAQGFERASLSGSVVNPVGTGSYAPVSPSWANAAVGKDPRIATTQPLTRSGPKQPHEMSLQEFSAVHDPATHGLGMDRAMVAHDYIRSNFGPETQRLFSKPPRNSLVREHLRHIAHAMASGIPVHPDAISSYHRDILGVPNQSQQSGGVS